MNSQDLLDQLVELLGQLDIEVRRADLGGSGGSLVTLRGKQVLFVDTSADPDDQLQRLAPDIARLPALEEVYMIPELREFIEPYK